MARAAFYCVSDSRYFPGVAGMVNSLRLHGHDEPVYVLDCGLGPEERSMLGATATLVAAPEGTPPFLLKTIAPLRHPAEVMVLIDADMIVTRHLGELVARAAAGGIVAFRNDSERFVAEWGELLGLGEARRGPYVSSGFVALGGEPGRRVLELLHEGQRRVDFGRTFYGTAEASYPFMYPEQDVLNGVLRCGFDAALTALDHRLAPNQPFHGLRVVSEPELRCAYEDGTEPYVLHHYLRKPWLEPLYHGAYSRLLRRALLDDAAAVRVPEERLPLRLRRGALAWAARKRADIPDLLGWRLREVLPDAALARIDERRRRRLAPQR